MKSLFIYVVTENPKESDLETLCFSVKGTQDVVEKRAKEFFGCVDVLEYFISTQEDGLENGVDESQVIKREQKKELFKYLN